MIWGIYKTTDKTHSAAQQTLNDSNTHPWMWKMHQKWINYYIQNSLANLNWYIYPPPLKLSSCCSPPTLGRALLLNLEFDFSCQPHPYGTFPLQLDDVIGTERWQYMNGQRRRATSTQLSSQTVRCDTKWSCSCRDTKNLHRLLGRHDTWYVGWLKQWWLGNWGVRD